jgi:putative DNA primase/helicase
MTNSKDEDIRAEARRLLEAETRAMAEADARNPVLPSVRTNSFGAAQILLERFFTKDGLRQFAYYRETWYSYYQQLWSERSEDDITHFLHKRLIDCRSVDSEGEIVDFNTAQRNVSEIQYQVQNIVSIPSHYRAPVALVGGQWREQDARGKIVCRGQIVDMLSGKVFSNHGMFIPNGAEWKWNAKAPKPDHWRTFLNDLFEGAQGEVELLQEWMGYVLSGDIWAHKGMIIVGPPRAGKGTIGHVLSKLLGNSMVASPSLHSLGKDFGLQPLLDKRLCLISDARLSNKADIMAVIEVLLRVTAGDAIDVGRKHKGAVNSVLDARVMMLSNEMPQLSDSSVAINTRFLILTLGNSFLGKEDTALLGKLETELPGIAVWAAEGYQRLIARGKFAEPESSNTAREEWYEENNPLSQFVADRCKLEPDERMEMTALYEAYKEWSEARGIPPMAANQLSRRLASQLIGKVRRIKSGSARYMAGLKVVRGDF